MRKLLSPLLIFLLTTCEDPGNLRITELDDSRLEKAILLDVRTPEEFGFGHLEGAMNINWYDADFKDKVAALDRLKTVYVYCKAGGRSAKAADVMREMGFKKVVNLEGGYDAYTAGLE